MVERGPVHVPVLGGVGSVSISNRLKMKIGDLVKYKNSKLNKCGIVLERGDYAFACDVLIYWFVGQYARGERTGDLAVLTST